MSLRQDNEDIHEMMILIIIIVHHIIYTYKHYSVQVSVNHSICKLVLPGYCRLLQILPSSYCRPKFLHYRYV